MAYGRDPLTGQPHGSRRTPLTPYRPAPTQPRAYPARGTTQQWLPQEGGAFEYPDYADLLSQWMQPYQLQSDAASQAALAFKDADLGEMRERFKEGQTSTLARLGDQYQDTLRDITNNLAARGMLQSGETKWTRDRAKLANDRAVYDVTNQYEDWVKQLERAFASAEQERLGALQQQKLTLADLLPSIYQPNWQSTYPFGRSG